MAFERFPWSRGAVLLCLTAPVWAQSDDPLSLYANYAFMQDSNLFRLPANTNVAATIGKPSAAEQIRVSTVGASYVKPYGLQQFDFNLSLLDNQYQNFSYLNYTATNYSATWHWSVTPRLRGSLSQNHQETLNSFTDYQGYNTRNQHTAVNSRLDALYELDGVWRVLGGLTHSSLTNQQPLVASGDSSASSVEAGIRRDFTTGSTLSYTLRQSNGRYLGRGITPSAFLDDGFDQLDSEIRAHLAVTGKSAVDFTATQFNRTHPHFSERNYSGLNALVSAHWGITGKSAVSVGAARELASYQTADTNYTQSDHVFFSPVWQFSPKSLVRLNVELTQRSYQGSPTSALTSSRKDTTRDVSLSYEWQALKSLALSASVQTSARSSNIANQDYESTLTSLSARIVF